jgi:hypothetical protein
VAGAVKNIAKLDERFGVIKPLQYHPHLLSLNNRKSMTLD